MRGMWLQGLRWKGLNLRSGMDDQQKQAGMSPSAEADADHTGPNGSRETRELWRVAWQPLFAGLDWWWLCLGVWSYNWDFSLLISYNQGKQMLGLLMNEDGAGTNLRSPPCCWSARFLGNLGIQEDTVVEGTLSLTMDKDGDYLETSCTIQAKAGW